MNDVHETTREGRGLGSYVERTFKWASTCKVGVKEGRGLRRKDISMGYCMQGGRQRGENEREMGGGGGRGLRRKDISMG